MNQAQSTTPAPSSSSRRQVWLVLKWLLFLLVMVFVVRRAVQLWNQGELEQLQIHPGWLALSGLAYVVGWFPSVWFWRKLMNSLGGQVNLGETARAYYAGHLGKYIPGKAGVLVIRATMMSGRGSPGSIAALTAAYETLAVMGVGAVVGISLLPTVITSDHLDSWPEWLQKSIQFPILLPVALLTLSLLLLPLLSRLFTRLAVKMAPAPPSDSRAMVHIPAKLLIAGFFLFIVSWVCHGLSLGLALRSAGSIPLNWTAWPVWTAAASLATVLGFIAVFAPGGLGIREGFLIEILRNQPEVGTQQAVVAAVLLRLVWLVAEILAAGVLYYPFNSPQQNSQLTEEQVESCYR